MSKKILVAFDGSELSKEALAEAKRQTINLADVEVHIVSVITQTGPTTNIALTRSIQHDMAQELHPILQEIKKEFEQEGITTFTEIPIDHSQRNAGHKLCIYAEEHGIDLIIVGNRGLGGVKGLFLGSVSNYIVNHAKCQILVLK